MERNIRWTTWDGEGTEHLHLAVEENAIIADGLIVDMRAGAAFSLHYHLRCDTGWHVHGLHLKSMHGGSRRDLSLRADGKGHWSVGGKPEPALDGCIDIDISATPFTNTLPIRRISLRMDEIADILVAYISIPELQPGPAAQRYTCLEQGPGGGRYRYESLSSGYSNELAVDEDGVVLDYPGLWKRVS